MKLYIIIHFKSLIYKIYLFKQKSFNFNFDNKDFVMMVVVAVVVDKN